MRNGYHSTNKGNERLELLREFSSVPTGNGHIRSATAYGTPDGIVVEVHGTRVYRHLYPWDRRPTEDSQRKEETEYEPDFPAVPPTVKTWGEFVPVKRVRLTLATNLEGEVGELWKEDVEGVYRDDPYEGSHVHEHFASTLNLDR